MKYLVQYLFQFKESRSPSVGLTSPRLALTMVSYLGFILALTSQKSEFISLFGMDLPSVAELH